MLVRACPDLDMTISQKRGMASSSMKIYTSPSEKREQFMFQEKKTSNSNTYVLHYPLRPINRWAVGSAYRAMDVIKRGEEMLKHFRSGSLFHYPSID